MTEHTEGASPELIDARCTVCRWSGKMPRPRGDTPCPGCRRVLGWVFNSTAGPADYETLYHPPNATLVTEGAPALERPLAEHMKTVASFCSAPAQTDSWWRMVARGALDFLQRSAAPSEMVGADDEPSHAHTRQIEALAARGFERINSGAPRDGERERLDLEAIRRRIQLSLSAQMDEHSLAPIRQWIAVRKDVMALIAEVERLRAAPAGGQGGEETREPEPKWTPEVLRELAEWLDNWRESPPAYPVIAGSKYAAGFLVRQIADALEAASPHRAPTPPSVPAEACAREIFRVRGVLTSASQVEAILARHFRASPEETPR